jgi:hypothetical protein
MTKLKQELNLSIEKIENGYLVNYAIGEFLNIQTQEKFYTKDIDAMTSYIAIKIIETFKGNK